MVALDEQGVIAALVGVYLLLVYLPRSYLAKKYRSNPKERLIRLGIYLTAIAMIFALRMFNTSLARERAEQIIAATERFKAANGRYPEHLGQLEPTFIPKVPEKAKWSLMDSGFRYHAEADSHQLTYVAMAPFLRRVYQFETRQWSELD